MEVGNDINRLVMGSKKQLICFREIDRNIVIKVKVGIVLCQGQRDNGLFTKQVLFYGRRGNNFVIFCIGLDCRAR